MSLAQYLALGKSIENVSGEGRYKVAEQPLAPNFNRHSPALKTEPDQEIPDGADQVETSETKTVSGPVAPTAPAQPVVRCVSAPAKPVSQPRLARGGNWSFGWGKNRRQPSRQEVAVQRELALDLVKPVCNDLLDSDLEAVPVLAQPVATVEKSSNGQPLWRRWGGGLWGGVRRWLPWRNRG